MSRSFSRLSAIVITICILAAVLGITVQLRRASESLWIQMRYEIFSQIEEELGVKISYRSVQLNTQIIINDLLVQHEGGELLKSERCKIAFSWWDYLLKRDQAALRVELEDMQVSYDASNPPDDLISYIQSIGEGSPDSSLIDDAGETASSAPLRSVAKHPSIKQRPLKLKLLAKRIRLAYHDEQLQGDIYIYIPEAHFETGMQDGYDFRVAMESELRLVHEQLGQVRTGLSFDLQSYDSRLKYIASLEMAKLRLKDKVFAAQRYQLVYENGELALSKLEDAQPFDLKLRFNPEEKKVDLDISFEGLKLEELAVGLPKAHIQMQTKLSYDLDAKVFSYSLDIDELQFNDMALSGLISGVLSDTKRMLRAQDLNLRAGASHVAFTGLVDLYSLLIDGELSLQQGRQSPVHVKLESKDMRNHFALTKGSSFYGKAVLGNFAINPKDKTFDLALQIGGEHYAFVSSWQGDSLRINGKGDTTLKVHLDYKKPDMPLRFMCEDFAFPLYPELKISGLAEGQLIGGEGLRFKRIELAHPNSDSTFALSGILRDGRLMLGEAVLKSMYGDTPYSFTGTGQLHYDFATGLSEGSMEIAPVVGDVQSAPLHMLIIPQKGGVNARIYADTIPLSAIFPHSYTTGGLRLAGSLHGPWNALKLKASFKSLDSTIDGTPLDLDLSVAGGFGKLMRSQLGIKVQKLRYAGYDIAEADVDYDMSDQKVHIELPLMTRLTLDELSAVAKFDVDLREAPQSVEISGLIDEIRLGLDRKPSIPLNISYGASGIAISGGVHDSIRGLIASHGDIDISLGEENPIVGTIKGYVRGDDMDLAIDLSKAPLALLDVLDISGLRFPVGEAEAHITLKGSPRDPTWGGEALVKPGAIGYIDYIAEPMLLEDTKMVFTGKEAKLGPLNVKSGGSLAVFNAFFQFEGLSPNRIVLDVQAYDAGLPFDYTFKDLGFGLDLLVQGLLTIEVEGADVTLGGDLTLRKGKLRLTDAKKAAAKSGGGYLHLQNLKINTGDELSFKWPNERSPIISALLKKHGELLLNLDARRNSFDMDGHVEIQTGEIFYLQRNFYIQRGTISFSENEVQFDPTLSLTAKLRDIDFDGDPITLVLSIPEQRLSQMRPSFSSIPSRPASEVFSMLSGNFAPVGFAGDRALGSLLTSVSEVGVHQLGIITTATEFVRKLLHLDVLSVRTHFLQNFFLATFVYGDKSEYADKLFDKTQVTIGKLIGSDLFLQANFRFSAPSNRLYPYARTGLYDIVQMNFEFGLEWETPLFLFELRVQPELHKPLFDGVYAGVSWSYTL